MNSGVTNVEGSRKKQVRQSRICQWQVADDHRFAQPNGIPVVPECDATEAYHLHLARTKKGINNIRYLLSNDRLET
ncbi:MAG TPA: hypothetical protein VM884_11045, partial [Flavisolibacter sp.]|nr:hypothetical protein [Flavisolibacter sp.]